ncbi:MAG: hypothetical protein ACNI3H_13260 [Halarcobacter ebronensis]
MKKISILTCALLLGTSTLFAADTIDEAFKSGTVSGDITVIQLSMIMKVLQILDLQLVQLV